MKGEIEQAQESLLAFQGTESGIQRTKKQYQQSVEHLAKAVAKQEKAADPAKPNVSTYCWGYKSRKPFMPPGYK